MHMTKLAVLLVSGTLSSAALAADGDATGGSTTDGRSNTTFGTEVGAELRTPTPVENPGNARETEGDMQPSPGVRSGAGMDMEHDMGTMDHEMDQEDGMREDEDMGQDDDFPGSVRPDAGSGAPDR